MRLYMKEEWKSRLDIKANRGSTDKQAAEKEAREILEVILNSHLDTQYVIVVSPSSGGEQGTQIFQSLKQTAENLPTGC